MKVVYCLFHRYERWFFFYHQNWPRDNYSDYKHNRLSFMGTAIDHFHFQNNEMEDIDLIVYQSNCLGVEIFYYVNIFVGFMLHILDTQNLRPAKLHYAFPD